MTFEWVCKVLEILYVNFMCKGRGPGLQNMHLKFVRHRNKFVFCSLNSWKLCQQATGPRRKVYFLIIMRSYNESEWQDHPTRNI